LTRQEILRETDRVLDEWELGLLDDSAAAGALYLLHRGAICSRPWRRRASALETPDGIDGHFFEAIRAALPDFLRCYRTQFLTFALQKLKDRLRSIESTGKTSERAISSAARTGSLWVHRDPDQAASSGEGLVVLLERGAARARSSGSLAGLRRASILEGAARGRTLKQIAKGAGVSPDLAREVLFEQIGEGEENLAI